MNIPDNKNILGISSKKVSWNLTPSRLQQICIEKNIGKETDNGVLCVDTGKFTGRAPKDRYIVRDDVTEKKVYWGNINIPLSPDKFDNLLKKVVSYLSNKELYVRDSYLCADKRYRLKVRVVNDFPWSNIFAYNMFINPPSNEIKSFEPDWTVLSAPNFEADPKLDGTKQGNFSIINFKRKIILVGGSAYTGEIKKGMFSVLNFVLPTEKNVLTMHCSANIGKNNDTAVFFGLSGTGKTTLSANKNRKMIGDDEHGWTEDNEIFNFEGGCYAKVYKLTEDKEPEIYRAIKKGALLENVVLKNNKVDYFDKSKTENTRVSYPIEHIDNIAKPSIGHNLKNIFYLTCDSFGILPPISKITADTALFYFISGYTAKVAGTEAGVKDPIPSFSACFGEPFMPLHPIEYAKMLKDKINKNKINVWLVNTGWIGGPYGIGNRISLKYTRKMINECLNDNLTKEDFYYNDTFKLNVPLKCEGIPSEILNPRNTWEDKEEYDKKSKELASKFRNNFKKYFLDNDKNIEEYKNICI